MGNISQNCVALMLMHGIHVCAMNGWWLQDSDVTIGNKQNSNNKRTERKQTKATTTKITPPPNGEKCVH